MTGLISKVDNLKQLTFYVVKVEEFLEVVQPLRSPLLWTPTPINLATLSSQPLTGVQSQRPVSTTLQQMPRWYWTEMELIISIKWQLLVVASIAVHQSTILNPSIQS